jgi:hypothetical protein
VRDDEAGGANDEDDAEAAGDLAVLLPADRAVCLLAIAAAVLPVGCEWMAAVSGLVAALIAARFFAAAAAAASFDLSAPAIHLTH